MVLDGRKYLVPALGAVSVLVVAISVCSLLFAGRWRYDPDPPAKADAIVVLAGEPARARFAADLYGQGYAPIVYLCRPADGTVPPEEARNRDVLLKHGVPGHAIAFLPDDAKNTVAEARAAFSALPASVRSVLVVTSPKHVRRARIIFTGVLEARAIDVRVLATPYEVDPGRWWTDEAAARRAFQELAKTVLYSLGIRYWE